MKALQNVFTICLLFLAGSQILAQQGNVAAGGDASGAGGSMSYSVGQTDYLFFASPTGSLQFGLQQTFFFDDPAVPAIRNLTSNDLNQGEDQCFDATETIVLAGSGTAFIVEDGTGVDLVAGNNILMLPGTHVQQGAWMHARIAPGGPFCGGRKEHFLEAEVLAADDTEKPDAEKGEMCNDGTDKDGAKAASEPITTGLPDITQKAFTSKLFSVYPNPTRDLFTIELQQCAGAELMRVEVYNMRGERIITEELPAGARHALSLAEQQAGVYLVRMVVGDRMGIERVVKW